MLEDLRFPRKFMIRGFLIFAIVSLASCSFQSRPVMTLQVFQEAEIGMSESQLIKTFGTPLNVYHREGGVVIYEYIERFAMGPHGRQIKEARRYYFFIREGKVVSKQMVIRNQPAFEPMGDLL